MPVYEELTDDINSLLSCEFDLTVDGDVFWHSNNEEQNKDLPLFQCESYEVLRERGVLPIMVRLRFGASNGHILEFEVVEGSGGQEDMMSLTFSNLFILQCQLMKKFNANKKNILVNFDHNEKESSFHLLPALEEGFFSDFTIKSNVSYSLPYHCK